MAEALLELGLLGPDHRMEPRVAREESLEGKELAAFRGHEAPVWSAVFSPSDDGVLTASADGAAWVWLVRGADSLKLADDRVSRELTQDERRRYAELLVHDTAMDR